MHCPKCKDRYHNISDLDLIIKFNSCIHCIGEEGGLSVFKDCVKRSNYPVTRWVIKGKYLYTP